MAIFVRFTVSSVTYKFLLQDVEGKVTIGEKKAVQGLEKPEYMKWNSDGGDNQDQNQTIDNTNLIDACTIGDLPQVKVILSQDTVGINTRGKNGTPAMIAAEKGHREILELLVKKVKGESSEVFDILIQRRADTSSVNDKSENILHLSCQGYNVEKVKDALAQNSVDINSNTGNGMTPLLFAAEVGSIEVFDLLIEKGANTSRLNINRDSILNLACQEVNE
ncbi:putative ankyrin repeat protein RBE_0220 [Haliotis cracherodii]|uniref:putative ankyrin repeat protein RBE_0220 n=1 Tax=Haliotis cracherodii TaxID=6455 RepID=UPI0039E88953